MNQICITGNLTRDPELKNIGTDKKICDFSIAWNDPYAKDGHGEHYFNVYAFGRIAENVNQYCKKGSKVGIVGQIVYQSWRDAEGRQHSVVKINAREVEFLSQKAKEQSAGDTAKSSTKKQREVFNPAGAIDDDDTPF